MVDENFVPLRNRSNNYLIDRTLQKTGNYTGITGLSEQDAAIQDSQGRIADRTTENLVPSDIGVVRFRQLMLGQAKALASNSPTERLDAALAHPAHYRLRSGGAVTNKGLELSEVMTERFADPTGLASEEPVSG
jgi:hypothetical protein